MAPSVRRRHTPVDNAKQIIEAIVAIRQQKQIPNFERIQKYQQRYTDITPRRCKEHLNNAVSDGFIVEYTAIANKGSKTGQEQEGYRMPQAGEEFEDDGHDWYCFECNSPGEVYECSNCFRVYHQGCTREDTTGDVFVCSVCRDKEASKKKNKMKKKMLNTLLSYTILRLREKTRELHKLGLKGSAEDFKRFVYRRMDLNRMEQKVQASRYRCLEDFHADARTILHNCHLLFGDEKGGMTDLAVVMVKDCKYDLDEIELCPNCYYMSNAKPEDWFSQPCNPVHELVYAKQKGYSYWPAKIVKDFGGKSDVRFFGGWHQRAVIPAEYIKPIITDLKTMTIKRTAGFTKAVKELKKHQGILEERERELEATNGGGPEEEDEEEEKEEDVEMEEPEEEEEEPEKEVVEEVKKDVKKEVKKKKEKSRPYAEVEEDEDEEEIEVIRKHTPKKAIRRRESSQSQKKTPKTPKQRTKKRKVDEDNEEEDDEWGPGGQKKTPKTPKSPKKPKTPKSSTKKRKVEEEEDGEEEEEEGDQEDENREVSSTSVEKKSKKQRNSSKYNSQDELHTVTSSVDKEAHSPPVPTSSTSSQTQPKEVEHTSVQTDPLPEPEVVPVPQPVPEPISEKGDNDSDQKDVESSNKVSEEALAAATTAAAAKAHAEATAAMEERMTDAMADLTRRLEEKFEEDKKQALNQLSSRLEEDFGKDKKEAVERTIASMKLEVEKARTQGGESTKEQYMEEMKKLAAKHKEAVSQAKKKQWCQSCEDEAIYHCCWNTSYCSTKCQQVHWHKEHKRVCRRKRPESSTH